MEIKTKIRNFLKYDDISDIKERKTRLRDIFIQMLLVQEICFFL